MSLLIDALKKAEKAKQESAQANDTGAVDFSDSINQADENDAFDVSDPITEPEALPELTLDTNHPLQDGFDDEHVTQALSLEPTSSRAPAISLLEATKTKTPAPSPLEMEPLSNRVAIPQAAPVTDQPGKPQINEFVDKTAANDAPLEPAVTAAHTSNTTPVRAPSKPIQAPYQPGIRQRKLQLLGGALLGLALLIMVGGYYFITALNNIGGAQSYVTNPVPGIAEIQSTAAEVEPAEAMDHTTVASDAEKISPNTPSQALKKPADSQPRPTLASTSTPPRKAIKLVDIAPTQPHSELNIAHQQIEDPISVLLNQAYQAYQDADYPVAAEHYRAVLSRAPSNRDALLGLAVIAHRNAQLDSARQYYQQLLRLNPKDSQAIAGMIALQQAANPELDESRLKLMIDQEPEAAHLHFALGNQYVNQGRWAEAQQAFFRAHHFQPDNADYAFNLAVSLDQLRQTAPALQYYQLALQLRNNGNASFQSSDVAKRIAVLNQYQAPGTQP